MGFSVREMVADRIIKRIEESGNLPWNKPWDFAGHAVSRGTGKPYGFLNQLMLPVGEYATMKQINAEGGHVNKGAKCEYVVFWNIIIAEEENKDGEIVKKKIPFLKYYRVFNIKDTDLEPIYLKEYKGSAEENRTADEVFNGYVGRSGVKTNFTERESAYYSPIRDEICMPLRKQFKSTEEYYSTLFHETVHSTGHKERLGRLETKRYALDIAERSKEELVAEIGSGAILSHLGINTERSERNNAAYVKSWVKYLKEDKGAIIEAASKAQKAFDMIIAK